MNHVLLFKTDDGEHPLEIIDRNSDRWVSRSQLGNALGVGNLKPLHSRLVERGELRQGLHWRNESLPRPDKNGVARHREMVIYKTQAKSPCLRAWGCKPVPIRAFRVSGKTDRNPFFVELMPRVS
ncbi:hypothetical protein DENIS_3216 [Desulfonema ishimotonii]|uniref:Uncharacterized protein n=1 Tax=Desulfonema ishimotonii TaxID=45657 RepID=A0A401FZ70_9BACT|nr:hypothetical protein DENIS_3216 [Desulfonema ishimotonii]